MGGAKKMSLKQAEKQQALRDQKMRGDQRRRRSDIPEKKRLGIDLPDLQATNEDLKKMKAITPYALASKYDIRLSKAKNMLYILEKRGLVSLVASTNNLKVYRYIG
jgi:small subunit ribosomal protein S25e